MDSDESLPLFLDALSQYLRVWEEADWFQEYDVEQIAKWVGKKASETTSQKLLDHFTPLAEQASGQGAFKLFVENLKIYSQKVSENANQNT